jgi:hypothetical protein
VIRATSLALALFVAGDRRYVEDFEFLAKTVAKEHPNVAAKKVDWDAVCKEFKPRFEKCSSDAAELELVMRMVATLHDSHTDLWESKVDRKQLPSKFDGVYGGGMWFGFDGGRFVLRGLMPGHSLTGTIPLGATLVAVGGEPAWLALARVRRKVATFQGISSDASFWASLSNKLLPFGEKKQLDLEFLLPDGKTKKATVGEWGPGGRSFDFVGLFLPDELGADAASKSSGALATFLGAATKGASASSKKIGFLKVTGGQDAATVKSFHAAFDSLKGMDALLLDCRAMGGGSDDCAWEMCGRLFPKGADNGRNGRIAPSGSWQFDGPVVMLQDELEVSSAETFTWALCETKRAVSVGRSTGGWGIIPHVFPLPSGLGSVRIGVNDRPTPIKQVHTEGVGWPPDVLVPFGPELCAWNGFAEGRGASGAKSDRVPDPVFALGLEIVNVLRAGVAADDTRDGFHALAEGDGPAFTTFAKKAAKAKELDSTKLVRLFADDLKAELAMEAAALELDEPSLADWVGASRRLPRLLARAKAAGLANEAARIDKLVKAAKSEQVAQEALLALSDPAFAADDTAKKAWLAKHGATKLGKFVREHLWK